MKFYRVLYVRLREAELLQDWRRNRADALARASALGRDEDTQVIHLGGPLYVGGQGSHPPHKDELLAFLQRYADVYPRQDRQTQEEDDL